MQNGTAVKRLTTVVFVEEIEPVLDFWVDRLGFEVTAKVPEEGPLVFAMLGKDGTELMYQTTASIDDDAPQVRSYIKEPSSVSLFIEVDSLDAYKPRIDGLEILVEERTTFYGAREITLVAPCGTPVTLAEFGSE